MTNQRNRKGDPTLRARVREFTIPPIHDALVIGVSSPIGCIALRKAVALLAASPFEHIEVKDEVVSDVIVRAAILRRLSQEALARFVLQRLKPLMGPEEILHVDLELEVLVEGKS